MSNRLNTFLDNCFKRIFFVFIICICNNTTFAQGPWIRALNKSYLQFGISSLSFERVRYNNLILDTDRTNYDITNQVYWEYGLFRKIDVTVILPYNFLGFQSKVGGDKKSINGFGNITVGWKYNFINKKINLSGGVFFTTPSFQKDDINGLRTGFEAAIIRPFITFGGGTKKLYYYINSAYGLMTNNYSDYLEFSGEFGYNIKRKFHLIINANVKEPIRNESFFSTDQAAYAFTGNYLDKQKFVAFGIKVNYEFVENKYGLNLGVLSGLNGALGATNIPVSRSLNCSFYCKF